MSTTFEIGRWPAAISRCLSHSGEGPIFTSSNTRAVKRRQISGSISMRDVVVGRVVAARLGVGVGRVGAPAAAPVTACRSRATP